MSAKMDILVKKLTDAMLAVSKKKSSAYDSTATVRRIDGDTVWVHLPGGVDETPIQKTIACSPGDTVQVRVSEGRAWIQGNHSAPPTDDTTAIHARRVANKATTMAETAENTANDAQSDATIAREAATSAVQSAATAGRAASIAQSAAEAAQATADTKKTVFITQPTPPYHVGDLWAKLGEDLQDMITSAGDNLVDSAGDLFQAAILTEGTIYVCTVPKLAGQPFAESDWELATADEGLREWFWHDSLGAHVLGDATGYRNDITSTGMQIIDTSTETSVATFGASGAQIGVTSGQHLSLTASVPFRSYNASGNLIGQIGNDGRLQFGAGTNASGTESVAIGKNATALGADAVALGWGANAYGEGSRSLGLYTDAHAASQTVLGMWNEQKYIDDEERRDDDIAFIFGNGYYGAPSNAVEMDWCGNIVVGSSNGGQNIRNTLLLGVGLEKAAAGNGQLVIGTYNIKKTKPLIIGNGTSSTRANVFEVDWSGNLEAAGDITDGNGNVLSNKIDAATLVDYVTEQASSGDWRYRKWHSGKIEAWYEGTFSTAASTTARGSLYYSTWTLTIPSAIGFTVAPNTLIGNTGDSTTVIAVNGSATSATAMSGKVWRYASSSSALSITARIYAWQN